MLRGGLLYNPYVDRFELARFPRAETQRKLLREQIGQDVRYLSAFQQFD
jgi:hypothetical protein